jgi:hypothetical protein
MAIIPSIEIETTLQERLDAPKVWKEVCDVKYTNSGILKNPYLTDATQSTGTRGTGYTSVAVATVDDSVSITDYVYSAAHIDDADLAQKTFSDFMEIAVNMAEVLDEGMETAMLAEHAQWTNFDNASIGGSAGNITVSAGNIKSIVTGVKREIREAKGGKMASRNGIFFIWREADFEILEALASAEGFSTADDTLKNGIMQGFKYMGVEHYSSVFHTAGHVFAGVKKGMQAGIVKSTYGRVKNITNPVVSGAQISGVGLETRIDRKFKVWTKQAPIVFDVLVA